MARKESSSPTLPRRGIAAVVRRPLKSIGRLWQFALEDGLRNHGLAEQGRRIWFRQAFDSENDVSSGVSA